MPSPSSPFRSASPPSPGNPSSSGCPFRDIPNVRPAPAVVDQPPPSGLAFHWSLLLVSVAVIGLSAILSVRGREEVLIPLVGQPLPGVCAFKQLSGHDCPGCGLTRSFISLAHGRLADAWTFHPLGLFLFGVIAFQIPYRVVQIGRLLRGREEFHLHVLGQWVLVVLAVALIGRWILGYLG